MENKETPVLLLTGYLGSGKTTLLNRILKNEKGIRFAVIVNDIGEVNIDASLIQGGGVVGQGDDSLVALQNGCICCTLKMDLVQQLNDIINQKKFDYIVIEASGICEPAPIAQTISTYPQMIPGEIMKNGVARLDAIVTVVDALRMRDEFGLGDALKKPDMGEDDLASLVIQQIEFCNIILINKAAEISPDELKHLRAVIKAIQPKAEIYECNYGDVDFDKILNTHLFNFDKVATSARWIEAMEDDDDELENAESGEALEYGIETFVWKRRQPMNLGDFDEFVSTKWPKGVIRAKGMCYFADEKETCYLFEQSGKQFNITNAGQWYATMPAGELQDFLEKNPDVKKDWDPVVGDRMQKIVFIGQRLDRKAIEAELDGCLAE
ncbi:putative metal chaperone YciC [Hallella multisaccharivorax DSM 17128]|uniref:Cobalamin synthesis protein P47K n=1 Tax=Hallella multisaccharivorax DSM 17128 TaxID=688246 RepID=F8N9A6_9BACT|nr:GTP-binding protein [Hallella multisaccharivorax]EGN57715.1 cobalamin synthesis protein P47K [Hallella multisaccharivorax DSM 17128]GJG31024.1 putative metal chaperone YciC [Hallella multisaccharivorax DSM 17128]